MGFVPRRTQKKPSEAQLDPNQELVEDYGSKIRKVRDWEEIEGAVKRRGRGRSKKASKK